MGHLCVSLWGNGDASVAWMIARRDLMAAGLAVTSLPALALPVPSQNRIGFRLLRQGEVIGSHTLSFSSSGTTLQVSVAIDILVKLAFVPVYRYRHRATETWTGDRFDGIKSQTDRDGSPQSMRAVRTAQGIVVEGSKTARYTVTDPVYATTYWNQAMLQRHVINSEDGRLFNVAPSRLAEEQVPVAAGGTIAARHWKLDGELPLDLWYDAAGQWAHLVFSKDGSTVIYEKL